MIWKVSTQEWCDESEGILNILRRCVYEKRNCLYENIKGNIWLWYYSLHCSIWNSRAGGSLRPRRIYLHQLERNLNVDINNISKNIHTKSPPAILSPYNLHGVLMWRFENNIDIPYDDDGDGDHHHHVMCKKINDVRLKCVSCSIVSNSKGRIRVLWIVIFRILTYTMYLWFYFSSYFIYLSLQLFMPPRIFNMCMYSESSKWKSQRWNGKSVGDESWVNGKNRAEQISR